MKSIIISFLLIASSYEVLRKTPILYPAEVQSEEIRSYNPRIDSINLSGKEIHLRIEQREKEELLRNNLIRDFNLISIEEWLDFVSRKNSYDQRDIMRDIETIQSVSTKLEEYLQRKRHTMEEKNELYGLKNKEQSILTEEIDKLKPNVERVIDGMNKVLKKKANLILKKQKEKKLRKKNNKKKSILH